MNRFADLIEGLRRRAAGEKILKTLDALEILEGLRDDGGKKTHVRLPYSSDPRSFTEPWK
ncbi:MAG: hypothetical protein J2P53_12545 [Bradyrhizobiaceae bacterium]|nr:hypothetical protein [Bradyrhizobiaceae bacterium]